MMGGGGGGGGANRRTPAAVRVCFLQMIFLQVAQFRIFFPAAYIRLVAFAFFVQIQELLQLFFVTLSSFYRSF